MGVISEPTFLNFTVFRTRFYPHIKHRYVNDARPNFDHSKVQSAPAIMLFFKSKFIISQEYVKEKWVYGDELDALTKDQLGHQGIAQKMRMKTLGQLADTEFAAFCSSFLDRPNVPVTNEMTEMFISLMKLTDVPGEVRVIDLE